MTHYTRCLADQLRPYDITVNCIAPGDTRTGRFMGTRAVDQTRMVETGTLDRIATVDEVARVVEVFAGPLGAFVSGQVLRVDGGGPGLASLKEATTQNVAAVAPDLSRCSASAWQSRRGFRCNACETPRSRPRLSAAG